MSVLYASYVDDFPSIHHVLGTLGCIMVAIGADNSWMGPSLCSSIVHIQGLHGAAGEIFRCTPGLEAALPGLPQIMWKGQRFNPLRIHLFRELGQYVAGLRVAAWFWKFNRLPFTRLGTSSSFSVVTTESHAKAEHDITRKMYLGLADEGVVPNATGLGYKRPGVSHG
jgi:hypothetical protein